MKKAVAMVMAVVMMLAFGVTAFAANGPLTVEQAKQAALDRAGVKASEATFTRAYRDFDDGRQVYEIEFYVGNTEYDMDVDANTGRVTDFSTEYHGGYGSFNNQAAGNTQPGMAMVIPMTGTIGTIGMTVTGTTGMTVTGTGMTVMTATGTIVMIATGTTGLTGTTEKKTSDACQLI